MFSWFSRRSHCKAPARSSRRPELEILEDRNLPSVSAPFTISNSSQYDRAPATASSANGQSVVVWEQDDANGYGNILAQVFDFNHKKIGNDIVVANTSDYEFTPDVAMDAQGNFVVVWSRADNDPDSRDVRFAKYDNLGALVKTGGVLNTSNEESEPQVAMSDAGKFVVALTRFANGQQQNILAQRFDVAGSSLGAPIKVAVNANLNESDARIDMAENGRFAIAYHRPPFTVSNNDDVFLKRYSANGALESKTKIAAGVSNASIDVGITNTGRCSVVYQRLLAGGSDADVYLRTLSAGGTLSAQKALAASSDFELSPRLAINHVTGDFVLSYRQLKNDGDHVVVREFAKNGTPKEAEHDLGVKTIGGAISLDGLDRYFVAYESIFSVSDHDIKGAFGTLS